MGEKKERHLDIGAIAALARIAIGREEGELLADQLERIVSYVDRMKELDLEGVEPFFCALPIANALDGDVVGESFPPEVVLANAPESGSGQIAVPRVVEGD
ncbi:MAG: Asp-tRNA(Asn)/Glu-tRNA(Gln) amidotransferase subunit GatC [Puniceicoccales bacterium]|jgi:aspartyl-tRNA(Asn)/glutamyl-tRNA(Gln) amidotransferase subunit C|nr:Asp-tRNA(Asn)/Glu-tRNA(Gln) amidotransferase subunit GatC [Puniceicoccales bacterium]